MGIGSRLMRELLGVLRSSDEGGGGERRKVRQVVAVMALDEEGEKGGLGLRGFYEGFGFVLVSFMFLGLGVTFWGFCC